MLDVAAHAEPGLNRVRRDILPHLAGDGIAQAVEVVQQLGALR
jgi:hypothetical protein